MFQIQRLKESTTAKLAVTGITLAVLVGIAVPGYGSDRHRKDVALAAADIQSLALSIERYQARHFRLPESLSDLGMESLRDPWGTPYQYLRLSASPASATTKDALRHARAMQKARRDHQLEPINQRYDLFSVGKNRQSLPDLDAEVSADDVVWAGDGEFVGLAADLQTTR